MAVRTDIAVDSEGWPLLVKLAPAAEAKASTSRPSAEESMARGCPGYDGSHEHAQCR